jgi:lactoylglutathione lyase
MPEPIGQLSTLMINVEDMDKACAFYANTMGLRLKFRDGARWAAFDAGGVTLALAGAGERPNAPMSLNFKVANVDHALSQILATVAGWRPRWSRPRMNTAPQSAMWTGI